MTCYNREPKRPPLSLSANVTPDHFFRHPMFTLDKYNGPPALILPTYFLNPSATFNGLTAPEYQPYLIFPFFAKTLFEWLNEGDARGDFSDYYLSRYPPWTPRRGTKPAHPHSSPQSVQETLALERSLVDVGGGRSVRLGQTMQLSQDLHPGVPRRSKHQGLSWSIRSRGSLLVPWTGARQ